MEHELTSFKRTENIMIKKAEEKQCRIEMLEGELDV
jgi:hypothetical protein